MSGRRVPGNGSLLCRGHRTNLMPEISDHLLEAHRNDDLILYDQKFHV
jgi:hypothetical protein